LWPFIDTISTVWSTSSLGIDFVGPAGLQAAVDGSTDFCKDTAIGESYHKGQSCWREMVPSGTPGLHVCLPDSVHIDPHQTVEGKGTGWSFGGSWGIQLVDVCTYSMLAFLDHMQDVEGGRAVNVFTRFEGLRRSGDGRVATTRRRLATLEPRHPELSGQGATLNSLDTRLAALEPTLRDWATQGLEGDGAPGAQRVLAELTSIEQALAAVDRELGQAAVEDLPPPPAHGHLLW
jgi:hypothetical protein